VLKEFDIYHAMKKFSRRWNADTFNISQTGSLTYAEKWLMTTTLRLNQLLAP